MQDTVVAYNAATETGRFGSEEIRIDISAPSAAQTEQTTSSVFFHEEQKPRRQSKTLLEINIPNENFDPRSTNANVNSPAVSQPFHHYLGEFPAPPLPDSKGSFQTIPISSASSARTTSILSEIDPQQRSNVHANMSSFDKNKRLSQRHPSTTFFNLSFQLPTNLYRFGDCATGKVKIAVTTTTKNENLDQSTKIRVPISSSNNISIKNNINVVDKFQGCTHLSIVLKRKETVQVTSLIRNPSPNTIFAASYQESPPTRKQHHHHHIFRRRTSSTTSVDNNNNNTSENGISSATAAATSLAYSAGAPIMPITEQEGSTCFEFREEFARIPIDSFRECVSSSSSSSPSTEQDERFFGFSYAFPQDFLSSTSRAVNPPAPPSYREVFITTAHKPKTGEKVENEALMIECCCEYSFEACLYRGRDPISMVASFPIVLSMPIVDGSNQQQQQQQKPNQQQNQQSALMQDVLRESIDSPTIHSMTISKKGFFGRSQAIVRVKLDKEVVCPGDIVEIKIYVVNGLHEKMSYFSATLLRSMALAAPRGIEIKTSPGSWERVGTKIGSKLNFNSMSTSPISGPPERRRRATTTTTATTTTIIPSTPTSPSPSSHIVGTVSGFLKQNHLEYLDELYSVSAGNVETHSVAPHHFRGIGGILSGGDEITLLLPIPREEKPSIGARAFCVDHSIVVTARGGPVLTIPIKIAAKKN